MCDVDGGPNNTFQWEKDSDILANETMDTLQLSNVAVSDAGLYQCTVTNAAGNSSDSTQFYVAPNIITAPDENIRVNVSVSVTFTCVAEGFPVPDITWEYDGNSFSGSASGNVSGSGSGGSSSGQDSIGEVNTTVNGTMVTSTLTIDPVQYDSFGMYRCVANSSFLMRYDSAETTLHGATLCCYLFCSFTESLSSLALSFSLSLQCLPWIVCSLPQLE